MANRWRRLRRCCQCPMAGSQVRSCASCDREGRSGSRSPQERDSTHPSGTPRTDRLPTQPSGHRLWLRSPRCRRSTRTRVRMAKLRLRRGRWKAETTSTRPLLPAFLLRTCSRGPPTRWDAPQSDASNVDLNVCRGKGPHSTSPSSGARIRNTEGTCRAGRMSGAKATLRSSSAPADPHLSQSIGIKQLLGWHRLTRASVNRQVRAELRAEVTRCSSHGVAHSETADFYLNVRGASRRGEIDNRRLIRSRDGA
jgi:hypothetical protein